MQIDDLVLNPQIKRAIKEMGYTTLTPIQEKCIPLVQQGKDVVGQSETGSGKTAAFGLAMLEKIHKGKGLQTLILTPTRELCVQVTDALCDFAKYHPLRIIAVYGGVSINPQMHALEYADVVVGTPGRILDHLERGTIRFDRVRFLILDEVDKMFEMGFIEDVERIISQIPKERQTLLFSATLSDTIHSIARRHLNDPVVVKTKTQVDKTLLHQVYYNVQTREKFSLLVHLLKHKTEGLALVFCATRREVDLVTTNLHRYEVHAMAIHGGLAKNKRLQALEALKREQIDVLVATDVAARGLDIRNVSHVYNYDVPKSSEEYVHRIGRTARAGANGDAVTLLSDRDYENFDSVKRDRSIEIHQEELPQFERIPFQRNSPMHDGGPGRQGGHFGNRDGRGGHPGGGYGGAGNRGPRGEHPRGRPHDGRAPSHGARRGPPRHGGGAGGAGHGGHGSSHTGYKRPKWG